MFHNKHLTRSKTNRTLTGVIGGLGAYFDVDPVLLRVVFVLVTAFSGFVPGIVAYALMAVIIPEGTATTTKSSSKRKTVAKKSTKTAAK